MPSTLPRSSIGARLKQRWFLALFSLPFAGIGVGMLVYAVLPNIVDARHMQSWHQGQARLTSAELRVSRGDDSTTYNALATYDYRYNGRQYSGDRVAIATSADNIGSFQQELGRSLERAYASDQPVAVWINPDNPQQAVLNRELRWGLLVFKGMFAVVFGTVGLGLLGFVLLAPTSKLSDPKTTDEPWLTRREWASPVIKSNAKAALWIAWGFALLWNAIAMPIGFMAMPDILGGDKKALVVLLFPAVGLGLLVWALVTTQRWRRFGPTPLTMDPYPGAIGGQVGGTLELALPFDPDLMFDTTLSCLYSYMSGSGKDRRRSERLVWQTQGFAHSRSYGGKTRLEILFDVDDKLPASDVKDSSSYHLWRLHITAKLPGADYDRRFEIPVFPTGEKAQQLRALSTEHPGAAEQRNTSIEKLLEVKQIPGGVELFYPAFRKVWSKLFGMVGGAIFFAVGLYIGHSGGPIVFPIAFPLLGGLLFLVCVYQLLVSLRVRLDKQQLQTDKHILGVRVGGTRVARGDILRLSLKKSYSASDGSKHTEYFKLRALTREGKAITISHGLPGRETARQALESISLLTGVPGEDGVSNSQNGAVV